jgi:hypothetical protein
MPEEVRSDPSLTDPWESFPDSILRRPDRDGALRVYADRDLGAMHRDLKEEAGLTEIIV